MTRRSIIVRITDEEEGDSKTIAKLRRNCDWVKSIGPERTTGAPLGAGRPHPRNETLTNSR